MSDQTASKTLDSPPDQPQSDPDPSPAQDADSTSVPPPLTRNSSNSKLNAQAPEFVPSPRPVADPRLMIVPPAPSLVHVFPSPPGTPFPVPGPLIHHQQHGHHYHQKHPKEVVGGQAQTLQEKDQGLGNNGVPRNGLSDEAAQKLINQVEYYFSDVNLATTDHLIRFINKDPEGFVPISVVATFKKIKALISSNSQLAFVLRNSTKLAVSEDGKKVKRLHPVTNMDELQARIIVAENLPEDHCHQNLMKVFSAVGSVKSIRTCQPQPSNNGASSASRPSKVENMIYSNKLHAFVEYESVELAEKAIVQLNDEDDWRNGLRVRLLLKRGSKPAQLRVKKAGNESEVNCEEEDASTSEPNQNEKLSEESSGLADAQSLEHGEEQTSEKEGGKKGRNRNRVKGRGRGQNPHYNHHQNNKGNHVGVSPTVNEQPKQQPPPGPRMPDGTRGFSMGRGKPITVNTAE